MPYAYETFGGLKAALGELLADTGSVFWTNTEKGILINAALREWNAISRMFRDRGQFTAAAGTTFYDLRTVLKNGSNEFFLAPVITDAQLMQQGKYMLMEPSPDDGTTFSDGIGVDDFTDGFVRTRNQFLLETGLIISQPAPQVTAVGRVDLADDSIIDVRRASWLTQAGLRSALFREDGFAASAFSPLWSLTAGTPRRYSVFPDPLLTLQLIPPPNDTGTLVLQTISSGAVLDDFTPAILWGVLANICSGPGPANDPFRVNYCLQRMQEYVIIGQQITTVMQSYINSQPVSTSSVFDFDSFKPMWMVEGIPKAVGMLGSNLVALVPAADGGLYSINMDAVRNAPQMVNDSDPVPLGREYLDILLDYLVHLATFKQGGQEFQATFPAYDAFVKAGVAYNNRMNAQNLEFETLVDRALREEKQIPLREEAVA